MIARIARLVLHSMALRLDRTEALRRMPLMARYFDSAWYLAAYPDVAAAGADPFRHYLHRGAIEGRDPSALFSTRWYLAMHPDVGAAGVNPLVHYVRWGASSMLYRVTYRFAPHNVYSDAKGLRRLVGRVKAPPMDNPTPKWSFAPDAPLEQRPVGGSIRVPYPANKIVYQYDRKTNTYLRSVTGEGRQFDIGPGSSAKKKVRVAPKNVVVMLVPFVPIGDKKHRLDGEVVGKGPAWISTNGKTIKGTWEKKSFSGPTKFYDAQGNPVTFTIGQTFINVVPRGTTITVKKGTAPPPSVTPSPSPSVAP